MGPTGRNRHEQVDPEVPDALVPVEQPQQVDPPNPTPAEDSETADALVAEIDQDQLAMDQIVDRVLKGEFGNGQARRLALQRAGYDHRKVQLAIVRRSNPTL